MECITESKEHIWYLDYQTEIENYYKCRACDSVYRIMRLEYGKTE